MGRPELTTDLAVEVKLDRLADGYTRLGFSFGGVFLRDQIPACLGRLNQRVSSVGCPIEAGCRKRSEGKTAATSCPTYAISNVPGFQTARRDTDRKARTAQVRNTVWCLAHFSASTPRWVSTARGRVAPAPPVIFGISLDSSVSVAMLAQSRPDPPFAKLVATKSHKCCGSPRFCAMPPDIESRFKY